MKGTPAISTVVRVEPMRTNKLTRVECKYNFSASYNANNKTRTPSFKYIFLGKKVLSTYTYVNKVEVHVNSLWSSNSYTCISFNIPLLLFTVRHCNNLLDHGSYNQEESQCIQQYDVSIVNSIGYKFPIPTNSSSPFF